MLYDRYKLGWREETGIDCIMFTLNAEKHLKETLDTWYKEAPIRHLYVIDSESSDKTKKIISGYPRTYIWTKPGMTTGKAFELLKNMVRTEYFIWIDVGKIPDVGWYDWLQQHIGEADIFGTLRINYKDGECSIDPIIADPTQRMLGGPWFIRKDCMRSYHVDNDYAQRNIDIIIRQAIEQDGGKYKLIKSVSHKCYLPTPVTDKDELRKRHIQNAKGIVKYIDSVYARTNASYLFDDHWMLMLNSLDRQWVYDTSVSWFNELMRWRKHRLVIAKTIRFFYHKVLRK